MLVSSIPLDEADWEAVDILMDCLRTSQEGLNNEPTSPLPPTFTESSTLRKRLRGIDDIPTANGGSLAEDSVAILRSWLWAHKDTPYPTESDKKEFMASTNMTLVQINNWFGNARRRLLKKHKFTRPSKKHA
jgi:hypothetical protein